MVHACPQKSSAGDKGEDSCCWETIIGQELYKLSLTHLLADVASIVLVDGVRWFITKLRCCGKIRTWVCTVFRLLGVVLL